MNKLKSIIKYTRDMTLLYVEDNDITRESTYMLFEQLFKKIVLGIDGIDGLNKYKENQIDLIITDLNMPNMDGALMLKEIRKINNLIPAIILSAHNEQDYIIDSIKVGASSYLTKPLDMDKVFQAIYEAINPADREVRVIYDKDQVFDKYNTVLNTNSIVTIFDKKGIILYVNNQFSYIFGFEKNDIIGRPYYTLSKEKHDNDLIDEIWQTIKVNKKVWSGTIRYTNNHDKSYFLKGSIYPILDDKNEIIEFVSIREDITEMIENEFKKYDI